MPTNDTTLVRLLVTYRQQLYDLTDFADTHPGGHDLLLQHANTDVTQVFHGEDSDGQLGHSHSTAALTLLSDYRVQSEDNVSMIITKDDFLDLSRPIMWQLWLKDIDKAEYLKQVHIPRHTKTPRRFFHSAFLEFFSRTPWWVIPMLWVPMIVILLSLSLANVYSPYITIAFCGFGVALWSLLEYSLHRFVFHGDSAVPDNKIAIMAHFLLHGVHHYLPMDRYRLVFPPAMSTVIFFLIYGLVSAILPYGLKLAVTAGILVGYIMYDLTHYYIHHGRPHSQALRSMKSYHLSHHYGRHDEGFGITSKFWDHVFGTIGLATSMK